MDSNSNCNVESNQNVHVLTNTDDCNSIPETVNLDGDNLSTDPNKISETREQRIRRIKEQNELERQRKMQEMMESQKRAQQSRIKEQNERRKKIDEIRKKEEERRKKVEERKKLLENQEKERAEKLLFKNKEREHRVSLRMSQSMTQSMLVGNTSSNASSPRGNINGGSGGSCSSGVGPGRNNNVMSSSVYSRLSTPRTTPARPGTGSAASHRPKQSGSTGAVTGPPPGFIQLESGDLIPANGRHAGCFIRHRGPSPHQHRVKGVLDWNKQSVGGQSYWLGLPASANETAPIDTKPSPAASSWCIQDTDDSSRQIYQLSNRASSSHNIISLAKEKKTSASSPSTVLNVRMLKARSQFNIGNVNPTLLKSVSPRSIQDGGKTRPIPKSNGTQASIFDRLSKPKRSDSQPPPPKSTSANRAPQVDSPAHSMVQSMSAAKPKTKPKSKATRTPPVAPPGSSTYSRDSGVTTNTSSPYISEAEPTPNPPTAPAAAPIKTLSNTEDVTTTTEATTTSEISVPIPIPMTIPPQPSDVVAKEPTEISPGYQDTAAVTTTTDEAVVGSPEDDVVEVVVTNQPSEATVATAADDVETETSPDVALTEDDLYKLKLAEHRRLARQRKDQELAQQKRLEEEMREKMLQERRKMEEEAKQARELLERQKKEQEQRESEELEQQRLLELEQNKQKEEDMRREEDERQEKARQEEEERMERKRRLEKIMSRVKKPSTQPGQSGSNSPPKDQSPSSGGGPGAQSSAGGSGAQFKSKLLQSMMAGSGSNNNLSQMVISGGDDSNTTTTASAAASKRYSLTVPHSQSFSNTNDALNNNGHGLADQMLNNNIHHDDDNNNTTSASTSGHGNDTNQDTNQDEDDDRSNFITINGDDSPQPLHQSDDSEIISTSNTLSCHDSNNSEMTTSGLNDTTPGTAHLHDNNNGSSFNGDGGEGEGSNVCHSNKVSNHHSNQMSPAVAAWQ